MSELLDFENADGVSAGAVGLPGQRAFYLQARQHGTQLTVLLEKEQVAMLAREATEFLDRLADEFPEDPAEVGAVMEMEADLQEPTVPLFRVRVIGLGFDPSKRRVLLELREYPDIDDDALDPNDPDRETIEDGYVARVYVTRAQIRAMCTRGEHAVAAGRPPCPLCFGPMDIDGHRCPRWN
jgi:uncharacterized repeat protein (TIGR03847 family)